MPPKKYKISSTAKSVSANTFSKNGATFLVIVESPSKCQKIESFLGDQYKCISSKGHIRSIESMKDIDIKHNFAIKFSIIEEKKDHVAFMRKCISQFLPHCILIATDDDREGEAIGWHICDVFGLSVEHTPRITFHEITKPAVLKAVANPLRIHMDLVHAQHARQVLDMIVGFKISPFLWRHICNNKSNGLSAGRCQTPALRLVYDREKEIEKAGVETKYKTTATFFTKNLLFYLDHDFLDPSSVKDFFEKSNTFNHMFSMDAAKDSLRQPPKPFNTSGLLQTASNVLHMSPKETMQLCQQLYQGGHITYMRTDNTKYSGEFLEKAKQYIVKTWEKNEYVGNFENILNRDETNPHEAIRATHIEYSNIDGLDKRAAVLYKLIWKNTVASCMSTAKYQLTNVFVSAPDKHSYKYVVEIPLFLGWKIVEGETLAQNEGSGLLLFFRSLLASKSEARVLYNKIESVVTVSNKVLHYTEASLIHTLEDAGIGRPSTFAMIVDTIQERGYVKCCDIAGKNVDCIEFLLDSGSPKVIVENKKQRIFGNESKKLVLQPLGLTVVEFLVKHFEELFSYDYTKKMEDDLDKVVDGGVSWQLICSNCCDEIGGLTKKIKDLEKTKYLLDDDYEIVFHQYGASLKKVMEDGQVVYKNINPAVKIDLEKLKGGHYKANDLIQNDCLGKYNDCDVFLKNGKYGIYASWGTKTQTLKSLKKPMDAITLDDFIGIVEVESVVIDGDAPRKPPQNPNILRVLDTDTSIRKGKFGPYIYYMPSDAKKPQFFNIGKYKSSYASADIDIILAWIKDVYLKPSP
jgi:DNA topoisomerase-1